MRSAGITGRVTTPSLYGVGDLTQGLMVLQAFCQLSSRSSPLLYFLHALFSFLGTNLLPVCPDFQFLQRYCWLGLQSMIGVAGQESAQDHYKVANSYHLKSETINGVP